MNNLPTEIISYILTLRPAHPNSKLINDIKNIMINRLLINHNNLLYGSFMELSLNIINIDGELTNASFKNFLFTFIDHGSFNFSVINDYDNIYTNYGSTDSLFFENNLIDTDFDIYSDFDDFNEFI